MLSPANNLMVKQLDSEKYDIIGLKRNTNCLPTKDENTLQKRMKNE